MSVNKLITTGVFLTFATTQLVSVAPAVEIELRHHREVPGSLQIQIPNSLASVEEVYEAPPQLDPRLIIHIQNAHGNYDAQVKIEKLLQYLHDTYGFDLVFVEGAAQELDASQLNLFPEPEKNIELIHYLAKKGEATGVDLYMMEHGKMEGIGIEEIELYRANFETFKAIHTEKDIIENFLSVLESKLDVMASRYLGSDLRRMLIEWQKFNNGQREFLPYIKKISKEAKRILGLDLESLFSQVEWPQLTRLLAMQSMEEEIDRAQAIEEKHALIKYLKTKPVRQELIQGIERLEEKSISMSWLAKDSEEGYQLPRHLLEKLVEQAGAHGFEFKDYPAFSLYAGYLILQSELETSELFNEIERIFEKILKELAVTEEEKDLLEIFRDMELLKKLLHLELSRKEWSRAFYRADWIRPDAMIKRLKKVSDRIFYDGHHQFPASIQLDDLRVPAKLGELFGIAFKFYDLAKKRESAFYYKIKTSMNERQANKAVLVTGGFHTDGLMEFFREDQISYGIVTPKIERLEGSENYIQAMLQTRPNMFNFGTLEVVSPLQPTDIRNQLGQRSIEWLQSLLTDYFAVANFTSVEAIRASLEKFNATVEEGKTVGLSIVQERGSNVLIGLTVDGNTVVNDEMNRYPIVVPLHQPKRGKGFTVRGDSLDVLEKSVSAESEVFVLSADRNNVGSQIISGDDFERLFGAPEVPTQALFPRNAGADRDLVNRLEGRHRIARNDVGRLLDGVDASALTPAVLVTILTAGLVPIGEGEPLARLARQYKNEVKTVDSITDELHGQYPDIVKINDNGAVSTMVFTSENRSEIRELYVKSGLLAYANQLAIIRLVVLSAFLTQDELDKIAEDAQIELQSSLRLDRTALDSIAKRLKMYVVNREVELARAIPPIINEAYRELRMALGKIGRGNIPISEIQANSAIYLDSKTLPHANVDLVPGILLKENALSRTLEEMVTMAYVTLFLAATARDNVDLTAAGVLADRLDHSVERVKSFDREQIWSPTTRFSNFAKTLTALLDDLEKDVAVAIAA